MNHIIRYFSIALISFGIFLSSSCNKNEDLPENTVADIDGNIYHTVKIGTQVWMVENLKTTKLNNGFRLPMITDSEQWNFSPGYCWYNNNENYKSIYGALYNQQAINTGLLCPKGWRIPKPSDWNVLITYLGGENEAGGKLKEAGFAHWLEPNTGASNESGFTALPGGYRTYNFYTSLGTTGSWWTASDTSLHSSLVLSLFNNASVYMFTNGSGGHSVRCIQGLENEQLNYIKVPPVFIYRTGVTSPASIELEIPKGKSIESIEVNYFFVFEEGMANSNMLSFDIEINGANTKETVTRAFPVTWNLLQNGIVLPNYSLPASDLSLELERFFSDSWEFRYTIKYTDGSRMLNDSTTKIMLENQYAGKYLCTGIFLHPVSGARSFNEEKILKGIGPTISYTTLGDLGESGYDIYIKVEDNNSCTVTSGPHHVTDVFMSAGLPNTYNPNNKEFNLNYYYPGNTGNRVISENYTFIE
jgi:uncharacterized protein (TIGR02145 family)